MASCRFGIVFLGRNHPVGYGVALSEVLAAAIHLANIRRRSSLVNGDGIYVGGYDEVNE